MPPKKICFVADSFTADPNAIITGPAVQIYLLAKQFLSMGWKVSVVSYSKNPIGLPKSFEGISITWISQRPYLPILKFGQILNALHKTDSEFFYQRGRDVLTGMVAIYSNLFNKTFIWASSGESGTERNKFLNQLKKKKTKNPFRFAALYGDTVINDILLDYGMKNADFMIVQTKFQKLRLLNSYRRVSVVIKSGHPAPTVISRQWPFKILWIGSIKGVKRPELFIELAQRMRETDNQFWMAGTIADRRFESLIAESTKNISNFKYLGPVSFDKSANLIASAHILINTTDDGFEGLPNAFVQAWLAGTVTMSFYSDPDGIISSISQELISSDLDRLKKTITFFRQNPDELNNLSRQFRAQAIQNFSIKKIAENLINVMTTASL